MSITVSIIKGYYRGDLVSGNFELVKPYSTGNRGGFITIKNPAPKAGTPPVQRISVELGDFTILNAEGKEMAAHEVVATPSKGSEIVVTTDYEKVFSSTETEEEAMNRIKDTFSMLDQIVDASSRGVIRGLVVSGPPGVGKSFGVEKQLETVNLFRTIANKDPNYEIVSGGVSSIGLYQKLYFNREKDHVLVFDDCDGILFDEESLNILKAALNSGDRRRICWNKESRVLLTDGVPNAFDFEGSIIFLSNIDFNKTIAKGSRISAHLEAIMSRCHYLDLEISSQRDKLLRIRQVIRDGMLSPYSFTADEEQMIIDFITDNADYLRELSLRMVKKVADFVKADPKSWHTMAEATCLEREARFKRLVEAKNREAAKRGVALVETV